LFKNITLLKGVIMHLKKSLRSAIVIITSFASLVSLFYCNDKTVSPTEQFGHRQNRLSILPSATVKLEKYPPYSFAMKKGTSNIPSITPSTFSATLPAGQSVTNDISLFIPSDLIAPKLDIVFIIDLTGSMGTELNNLKVNSVNMMNLIRSRYPDVRFAVISHMDYTQSYSSCGYSDRYGYSGDDYPYRLNQPFTTDNNGVAQAIDSLYIGDGWDTPENYSRVLYETFSDTAIHWRSDAKKILLYWQDDVPHDCNYVTDCNVSPDSLEFYPSTGVDPGRDGIKENADDPQIETVLQELASRNITLMTLHSGNYLSLWNCYTSKTGGKAFAVDTNGTVPEIGDIAHFITSIIMDQVKAIDTLTVKPCDVSFSDWITSVVPESYNNVYLTTNQNFPFSSVLKVPDGTAPGVYEFDLCATGDDVTYAQQHFFITVIDNIVPPVADAGSDDSLEQMSPSGTAAQLDGSLSYDPGNQALNYKWTENNILISDSVKFTHVFSGGLHKIQLIVTNTAGLSDTDSVDIIIKDTRPPVFTNTSASISVTINNCKDTALTLPQPTISDIADLNPVLTNNAPSVFHPGTTSVVFTASDASGNTSTLTLLVTINVNDLVAPIPDELNLPPINAECSVTITTRPTATDSCSGVITATTTDSLSYNTPGIRIITWRYVDASGNSSSQTQTVAVTSCCPIPTDSAYNYAIFAERTIDWAGSGTCNAGTSTIRSNGQFTMTGSPNFYGNVLSSTRLRKTGSTMIYGNATAPVISEVGSGRITGAKTIAPVSQLTVPSFDVAPYYDRALAFNMVKNGNVHFTGSRDTIIPGGVLYVNGNFRLSGSMNFTGCIIASGNIDISTSGNISRVYRFPVAVSINGSISYSGSGNMTGLIFAQNGDVTKTGSGNVAGSIICKGDFKKTGSWNVFTYQNSAPLPPGCE
jgi:hypothetical protein